MRIGLISDTHDHLPNIRKAITIFEEENVGLVLHAGDYCSPFTIPHFRGFNLKGIFGNNDGDHYLLLEKFKEIEAEHLGSFGELEIDGKRLALYHGTDALITAALEQAGNFDIVVTGHTHERKVELVGQTLAVNPGTVHGFDDDATVAVLDTEAMDVSFIELK